MTLVIGCGINIGNYLPGMVPLVDLYTPAATITSKSNLVVTGAECINPSDVLLIVTSKTFQVASIADSGMSESGGAGTGLTGWTNAGSAGAWAQGGIANTRPVISTTGGPNNRACFTTDGSLSWLPIAYDTPAPSATPFFCRMVVKVVSTVNAGQILCGSTTNRLGVRTLTGNTIQGGNAVNGGTISYTVGTWYVLDYLLNNATTDYIHIGATKATGTNLGGADVSGSIGIGARSTGGAGFANVSVSAVYMLNGEPTGTELTNWNTWLAKWYGPSLVLAT
jgi:hypothetical protein